MTAFAERRKAADLTQTEAAKALGVDQSTVALWETGKTRPRAQLLLRIAELYHCSVEALLSSDAVPEA